MAPVAFFFSLISLVLQTKSYPWLDSCAPFCDGDLVQNWIQLHGLVSFDPSMHHRSSISNLLQRPQTCVPLPRRAHACMMNAFLVGWQECFSSNGHHARGSRSMAQGKLNAWRAGLHSSEVRSLQGHWYSLPLSSIMAAMGWPCSFLELSSYILAPLLMMSHVSCKVFAWQGPGKWMHCLMRPLIDHIGRPAPRARACTQQPWFRIREMPRCRKGDVVWRNGRSGPLDKWWRHVIAFTVAEGI